MNMSGDLSDDDIIPISTSISTTATASSTSYTSDQLQRFLKYEKRKFQQWLNSVNSESLKNPWNPKKY